MVCLRICVCVGVCVCGCVGAVAHVYGVGWHNLEAPYSATSLFEVFISVGLFCKRELAM